MLLGRAAVTDGAHAHRTRRLPAGVVAAQDTLATVPAAPPLVCSGAAGAQKACNEAMTRLRLLADDRAGCPCIVVRLLHAAVATNDGGPLDPVPEVVVAANGVLRSARLVPVKDVEACVPVARPDVQGRKPCGEAVIIGRSDTVVHGAKVPIPGAGVPTGPISVTLDAAEVPVAVRIKAASLGAVVGRRIRMAGVPLVPGATVLAVLVG